MDDTLIDASHPAQNNTIAVVEDDAALRLMYKLKLEHSGFKVSTAEDGIRGLEIVEQLRPSLILLDLRMPKMSGDEMLSRLRAKEWGWNIKVIILTNISKSEAPHRLRLLNVDRYIVKAHYTPAEVVQVVEELLKDRQISSK